MIVGEAVLSIFLLVEIKEMKKFSAVEDVYPTLCLHSLKNNGITCFSFFLLGKNIPMLQMPVLCCFLPHQMMHEHAVSCGQW